MISTNLLWPLWAIQCICLMSIIYAYMVFIKGDTLSHTADYVGRSQRTSIPYYQHVLPFYNSDINNVQIPQHTVPTSGILYWTFLYLNIVCEISNAIFCHSALCLPSTNINKYFLCDISYSRKNTFHSQDHWLYIYEPNTPMYNNRYVTIWAALKINAILSDVIAMLYNSTLRP